LRIWDLDPGYLNDQSLLGEHRELHAIAVVLGQRKKGYSRHPETLRWKGFGWALRRRHRLLAAEMSLRGFNEKTPVRLRARPGEWPGIFIDAPGRQIEILRGKYLDRKPGRIPLPRNAQELWAQHKYSVMARDPARYMGIGARVSVLRRGAAMDELAAELVQILRTCPPRGRLQNALLHMWGHVSPAGEAPPDSPMRLLARIRTLAIESGEQYILHSTALGELGAWLL